MSSANRIENFLILYKILPILSGSYRVGVYTYVIRPEDLPFVLTFVSMHVSCQYKQLTLISVVDHPTNSLRFEIVYDLLSIRYNHRLRLKVWVEDSTLGQVPTAIFQYPCANWNEREGWDLFGVVFKGHEDLRRILTDYGFQGHPLRKDFPLSGFTEYRYNEGEKKLKSESPLFDQSFRVYDYHSSLEKQKVV